VGGGANALEKPGRTYGCRVAALEGMRTLPRPPAREQAGALRRILRDPQPVLDELAIRYGPIVGLGASPLRMVIVGDPSALREMFAMPAELFRWGHRFNVLGFVVGRTSMLVSDGADHKRRRGSVQAVFSRRRLNGWIPTIVERTDAAIDRVLDENAHDGAVVDLYPVGRALVLDIVVRLLFGDDMAAHVDEIGARFQGPQDYLESPALKQLPHPFPGTTRARVRADRQALDVLMNEAIARRRVTPTGDPHDVLDALVSEGELSDAEIRDQMITLIGAGYDTTSGTLAWMLWCCALTPGLWERVRLEADDVLGSLDDQTLARLDLASRVVRETTRLHPAGVISPRQVARDISLRGYHIPKGTMLLWSAHLAGRDASVWNEPLRFDPDRFVDMAPQQRALADMAWVPFGRGARNCVGFALAQMELTLIVARLAQRLDLAPTADREPRPVGMVVNRPAGGAPVRISARA
jgi:cytochrome P450